MLSYENPYRAGAGHTPPFLAGRHLEINKFKRFLKQTTITENIIISGLRGIGKSVLLEQFKHNAIEQNWLWLGSEISESAIVTEDKFAQRILVDIAMVTRNIAVTTENMISIGFSSKFENRKIFLDYHYLSWIYNQTPGLEEDKLKYVLNFVAPFIKENNKKGIVFCYDEAQLLSDHAGNNQYPLSMLLSVFQSIQKQDVPFMLLLSGLPTLYQKLLDARTYSERMFTVFYLDRLDEVETRKAIVNPVLRGNDTYFSEEDIEIIANNCKGYPFLLQFICREAYDIYLQRLESRKYFPLPIESIIRKLDDDFFAGRWHRVTTRQRDLLYVISQLNSSNDEFSLMEIREKSEKILQKPFGNSQINQLLLNLMDQGLVYKGRHGKYFFSVPLFADFVARNAIMTQ
jgi:hypothetical protein